MIISMQRGLCRVINISQCIFKDVRLTIIGNNTNFRNTFYHIKKMWLIFFLQQNLEYTLNFYHLEEFPCIAPNQTFEFFFNITTERGKTPGSLVVKFPGEETVFSVHEYRIIHVGKNLLPCFQTIQLDGSLDQYT